MDLFFFPLQLGLSFTIPFLSIPMTSLINIGETTSTALSQMLSFNWPSIVALGLGILLATFVVPYAVKWLTGALLLKESAYNAGGFPYGYSAPDGPYSRNFDGEQKNRVSYLGNLVDFFRLTCRKIFV